MIKINNKKYYIIIIVIAVIVIILIILFNKKDDYEYLDDNIISSIESNIEGNKNNVVELQETIKIHILGEVNYNGILELNSGSRISDAIEKAGGLTSLADVSKINLAYVLEDGEKLYIPSVNDEEDIEYLISDSTKNSKVNINTAKLEELQDIPGVGPSIAQAIIDYRDENGKFKTIEDIKNVSGVGDSKYKKMEEYIKVK